MVIVYVIYSHWNNWTDPICGFVGFVYRANQQSTSLTALENRKVVSNFKTFAKVVDYVFSTTHIVIAEWERMLELIRIAFDDSEEWFRAHQFGAYGTIRGPSVCVCMRSHTVYAHSRAHTDPSTSGRSGEMKIPSRAVCRPNGESRETRNQNRNKICKFNVSVSWPNWLIFKRACASSESRCDFCVCHRCAMQPSKNMMPLWFCQIENKKMNQKKGKKLKKIFFGN